MAVTIQELVTRARDLIGDHAAPYRITDAAWLRLLYDALVAVWSVHPEAFWMEDITTDPPAEPTTLASSYDLDRLYIPSVVFHACRQYFLEDSEEAGNAAMADRFNALYLAEV